jgi:hypothetical protein
MSATSVLSAVGLFIGLVAAILMYYYPPRISLYTEKGEPYGGWVGNPTEKGKVFGWWQVALSKAAPWLLALAFFLQLVAVLMPVFP